MSKNLFRVYNLIYLVMLGLMLFLCFYKLGENPISDWDAARHGVNAYEMLKNKDFIASYYNYDFDYWNLKPPLSYWLIMLGYKIFGFNNIGLRAYSAVSYFLIAFLVSLFLKYKHNIYAAIASLTFFSAEHTMIHNHMARSGDADAVFLLFFTASILAMLMAEQNKKWLFASATCFQLAFLTKSWHAGCIIIIGILFIIITKMWKKITIKDWLLLILSSFWIILIWAILRFSIDGFEFFDHMINYDLFERSSTAIEGHINDWWFYLNEINQNLAIRMFLVISAIIITSCISKLNNIRKITLLWIFVPFILFTIAKTRLPWYIYPSYVGLIFGTSVLVGDLSNKIRIKKINTYAVAISFAIPTIICVHSIYLNVKYVADDAPYNESQNFLRESFTAVYGEKTAGKNIYMLREDNQTNISQGDLLCTRLYGDTGKFFGDGIDGFLNNSNSILFIDEQNYSQNKDKLEKYMILYYYDNLYLIAN